MTKTLPKQLITSLLLLFFCLNITQFVNAQGIDCPDAPADLSIGCGSNTTITADPAHVTYSYEPNSTTFPCGPAPIPTTNTITAASLNPIYGNGLDDGLTYPINIGFPFDFYGNTYNDVVIGTNGILGFGTILAPFAYFSFTAQTMPAATATGPRNYIAGMYADIDIRCGGSITYALTGTAPNRRFVVSYNNVAPFGGFFPTCGGTGTASFQVILNEGGTFNIVITQLSANWNATTSGGPLVTVGAMDLSGNNALPMTGYNSQDPGDITPCK